MPTLDVTNSYLETVIFDLKEMLGSLDLRLIEYYKIKQGIFNKISVFRFKSAEVLCDQFNKFINTLKKENEKMMDKYQRLDQGNERRNVSDKEILDKFVDLEKDCLSDMLMDMLYKYKYAFSLRDEIGTCPNIEVEIDITDKSPLFIRLYHVKEEDKICWTWK